MTAVHHGDYWRQSMYPQCILTHVHSPKIKGGCVKDVNRTLWAMLSVNGWKRMLQRGISAKIKRIHRIHVLRTYQWQRISSRNLFLIGSLKHLHNTCLFPQGAIDTVQLQDSIEKALFVCSLFFLFDVVVCSWHSLVACVCKNLPQSHCSIIAGSSFLCDTKHQLPSFALLQGPDLPLWQMTGWTRNGSCEEMFLERLPLLSHPRGSPWSFAATVATRRV